MLEIGAGTGEAALAFAAANPTWNVLTCEVHLAALAMFFLALDDAGLRNVRIASGDAVEFVDRCVASGSVDVLRAFFPDPWPKARQAHRRLVQQPFADRAARLLRDGGVLELATDDPGYARQMKMVLDACPQLEQDRSARAERPMTHYEKRATAAGRPIADLRYRRARRLDT